MRTNDDDDDDDDGWQSCRVTLNKQTHTHTHTYIHTLSRSIEEMQERLVDDPKSVF